MGKGIGHVYNYNQRNLPYLSPNTKFVEPQSLLDPQLQVTTDKKCLTRQYNSNQILIKP